MSGCGEVFYCSRECNMHHASAHRLRCRNLRCSKFNDSESESDSDDSDEYETDSSAEYETDSDDDEEEEEEEEEEVKPKKKKGKKKGKSKARRVNSTRSVESTGSALSKMSMDSEVEKRIEEKIMKRLKKQEESRIASAIESRMREEKANWRDDEMNRIIMEMRERFQSEMSTSAFWTTLAKKNGLEMDSQEMQTLQKSMEHSFLANPQSEDKMVPPGSAADGGAAAGGSAEATVSRTRSVSKESSWNNSCATFEALRVVVWKHSFLPRMQLRADNAGVWNTVTELDADEAFAHISVGDKLLSINGRAIDDSVPTENDLNDVFAAYASPLIMKFEAGDPSEENCKVHDYTVTWSNGPLGVTLKDDCATQKIPIVNRLTKKSGSVAVKQNIAIGDVLVAINNIDTIQLGCSLSMSILKKVQLPAKLRFRGVGGPRQSSASSRESAEVQQQQQRSSVTVSRAPSGLKPESVHAPVDDRAPSVMNFSMSLSRPSKYSINWGEGPLGLTIIPGLNEGDLPVIKKVTGTGNSPGIDKAQVGDYLESMNGMETATMHFENVVSYLKTAPKPVLLQFRAAIDDDDARGASYRSNGTALSAKSDTPPAYDNAPVRNNIPMEVSRPAPTPIPGPGSHGAEIVRQVSRQQSSDVYKVVWGSGPLGLTIDANIHGPGAFIKRIAAQGAAAHLSQDCMGDDVTHINDMDVSHVDFQDIVTHLKSVPRPVTLFFKHGTPLGLSLRGADNTCEYPYITRVTGTGSAAHLPQSVMNDCLISVDGRSVHVRDKAFEEVMTLLKVMQKPLTLKFQTRNVGGNEEKFSSIQAPFLVQNKLSTGRRQKMLKGLKK
ncbi:hypothetical protein BBO99_00000290 [Phytophthora kernoviae]|uniref:PDZ domain-containing protein n=2 Tax=Phytophthora kernoviae TaxID=325452 RepID=A0A421H3I6_9STRA|nr:hypothetical protein G195_000826 [Phytophthora kernoviae 00238/432]KAG2532819.1 hypothetical protein JM16_000048 [Phytophthora kernoviae]RLN11062.1 hypothetical protein BBI17_000170 [Phytophthora kernoviae]RLN86042.1 hypothetical protein BBO99_00000290 [Phytophthora kernoviae]